jgi:hypothetical protein
MPLNNPRFLCRSRLKHPQLLKAALIALVADERTVDAPRDLTGKTTAQIGFYTHRALDGVSSTNGPEVRTPATLPRPLGIRVEGADDPTEARSRDIQPVEGKVRACTSISCSS